jgi:hypothetical protein
MPEEKYSRVLSVFCELSVHTSRLSQIVKAPHYVQWRHVR